MAVLTASLVRSREALMPPLAGPVDERYINAIKNLFNAVEIQAESATSTRPRWGN